MRKLFLAICVLLLIACDSPESTVKFRAIEVQHTPTGCCVLIVNKNLHGGNMVDEYTISETQAAYFEQHLGEVFIATLKTNGFRPDIISYTRVEE